MKKHLVLICGLFYPNPSPTGKCAEQYVSLLKDEYDIDVICIADSDKKMYNYNGYNVYTAENGYSRLQRIRRDKSKYKLTAFLSKAIVYLLNKFRQPDNLYWYKGSAFKRLKEIAEKTPIDVVFSAGAPIAAHAAAMKFKMQNPCVRWVAYTVDSYGAQNHNEPKYRKFESEVLKKADFNLFSEEIYDSDGELCEGCSNGFKVLPYLLPKPASRCSEENTFDKDKINLVYAGRFYKEIRNPEPLLKLALKLPDDMMLHLFCASDCDELIDRYISMSNGKIVRYPTVGIEEIKAIYMNADCLVSVGNNLSAFKPSKTFEYISTGKPIINLYYPGLSDETLGQYPLSFQLKNEDCTEIAMQTLIDFIRLNRNTTISFDKIEEIFVKHTDEYIKGLLDNAFGGDVC